MVTFLRFQTFIFWKIGFSNYVKNCKVWFKKHKEFQGLILKLEFHHHILIMIVSICIQSIKTSHINSYFSRLYFAPQSTSSLVAQSIAEPKFVIFLTILVKYIISIKLQQCWIELLLYVLCCMKLKWFFHMTNYWMKL